MTQIKRKTLTQLYSWLHTWSGLIFGWLLFAIFLTGTLAMFDKEIDGWMRPEIPTHNLSQSAAAQRALNYMQAEHPGASAWNIGLPTERSSRLTVSAGEQRRGGGQALDPQTGELLDVRNTAGGGFFFRFHFTLDLPRSIGIWVVGLAAIAMLVALISGIVIHKKFFKEFFTFRPAKGQRSWLDAHNASAVLVLPFHLMITYTGLVIFYLIYMPAAIDGLFDGDRDAATRALRGMPAAQHGAAPRGEAPGRPGQQAGAPAQGQQQGDGPRNGVGRPAGEGRPPAQPAALTDLAPVLAKAEQVMGEVASLSIQNPGLSTARIQVQPVLGNRIELTKGTSMLFDGVTGQVLREPPASRPSLLTQRVMAGLHFAQFGGYPMRWLYFLCGLASCAMLATGVVLFTVKRRRRHDQEGAIGALLYQVAERVNIAVVAGLSLACVAYLWGNRLLPLELAQRGNWEVRVFFLVWLASLGHAMVRPRLQAWREQLAAAALLCLTLPLLKLLGNPRGEHLYLEASVVVMGALLAWTSWKVGRPRALKAARNNASLNLEVQ